MASVAVETEMHLKFFGFIKPANLFPCENNEKLMPQVDLKLNDIYSYFTIFKFIYIVMITMEKSSVLVR